MNLIGSSVKTTITGDNIDDDNIWTFTNIYTKLINGTINKNNIGMLIKTTSNTNEITLTLEYGQSNIPVSNDIQNTLQNGCIICISKDGIIYPDNLELI